MSVLVWPVLQNLIMVSHIVINVLLVSMHTSLSYNMLGSLLGLWLMFMAFEKIGIQASAQVHEGSRNFLATCKRDEYNLRRRKVIKSLKPLAIWVGSCYFIKPSTFTTYLGTVVENTISVILAMQ